MPRLPVTHIREFAAAGEIRPLVGLAAATEDGEVKYALPYGTRRLTLCSGDRGSTVVKVLCYKSEGRWFDPTWCQWIFHSSDSTMALGSTQPLTEMSTSSISWG